MRLINSLVDIQHEDLKVGNRSITDELAGKCEGVPRPRESAPSLSARAMESFFSLLTAPYERVNRSRGSLAQLALRAVASRLHGHKLILRQWVGDLTGMVGPPVTWAPMHRCGRSLRHQAVERGRNSMSSRLR